MNINVSPEAVHALMRMSNELHENSKRQFEETRKLIAVFNECAAGLGPHANELGELMNELMALTIEADGYNRKMVRKVHRAAKIRQGLTEETHYRLEPETPEEHYIPQVLGRMYDDLIRQRIRPKELGPDGSVRGTWQGQVFCVNDDFVPTKFNPEGKNVGQIRQELVARYSIRWEGISYATGGADFKRVSVAQVSLADVMQLRTGSDNPYIPNQEQLLVEREKNFAAADRIAAQRQLSIPGLKPGYSATDLAAWREKNQFSWDESYENGYLLVPSVIHGNLAHTGLVAVGTHLTDAEKAFRERHGGGAE